MKLPGKVVFSPSKKEILQKSKFITLRTDMSHTRVTVIIYHAPLWDCYYIATTVIARVPVSGWLREVTPWKSDERLLQVPHPTSWVRYMYVEKLNYLSLNEAVDLYCIRDNSRKNWRKRLQWNWGDTAYTWDALDCVQRRVSFMENPKLIKPFKSGHVREIHCKVWESGAIGAF